MSQHTFTNILMAIVLPVNRNISSDLSQKWKAEVREIVGGDMLHENDVQITLDHAASL